MATTLHDPRYKRLIGMIVAARKGAGLTQRDVASKLKVPASYIGKVESLQRRLDVVELVDVLDAIGIKPSKFISEALVNLRKRP